MLWGRRKCCNPNIVPAKPFNETPRYRQQSYPDFLGLLNALEKYTNKDSIFQALVRSVFLHTCIGIGIPERRAVNDANLSPIQGTDPLTEQDKTLCKSLWVQPFLVHGVWCSLLPPTRLERTECNKSFLGRRAVINRSSWSFPALQGTGSSSLRS